MTVSGINPAWVIALLIWAWTPTPARVFSQSRQAAPTAGATAPEGAPAKRGEALFTRHCPICHLGRPSDARPFVGRSLRGILKGAKPVREAEVRDAIRKGSDKMPGFQYNLTPVQIEDLIAYLKTYN